MDIKKIVLVDDHIIVRNGLKELIEKLGPYKVTSEFDSGESLLKQFPFIELPDLVILDLHLPGRMGDEILNELIAMQPQLPVLMLTLSRDENMIVKLFRSGARGYLQKDCTAGMLRAALDDIFTCGYYHNEFLALSLKTNGVKKSEQEKVMEQLTAREKEFLKLVCHENEYTYEQIADQMKVQHRTVDGYREALFEKFGIKSKTGLVLFVLKHSLFEHLQGE